MKVLDRIPLSVWIVLLVVAFIFFIFMLPVVADLANAPDSSLVISGVVLLVFLASLIFYPLKQVLASLEKSRLRETVPQKSEGVVIEDEQHR